VSRPGFNGASWPESRDPNECSASCVVGARSPAHCANAMNAWRARARNQGSPRTPGFADLGALWRSNTTAARRFQRPPLERLVPAGEPLLPGRTPTSARQLVKQYGKDAFAERRTNPATPPWAICGARPGTTFYRWWAPPEGDPGFRPYQNLEREEGGRTAKMVRYGERFFLRCALPAPEPRSEALALYQARGHDGSATPGLGHQ